ncbi:S41 family peptidase [Pelomonas sp. SE-A7]|uniref:S41 family peptidase n=1 Tax=Pelomonas sp. SE-A7 TaxID=3054953 RepID=UPI00259D149E|nr:S41 family peptidase [Pelomonas sp. SE-A7]MDM4768483.1 S41 family peptidase [Pelomonas sp. SE-A7]
MIKNKVSRVATAALMAASGLAAAAPPLKPAERAALVEQIGQQLDKEFHDPARVPAALKALKQATLPAEPEALAQALTQLLQPALQDAHARVVFQSEPPPGARDEKPDGPPPSREALYRHLNCGVERVEHYPGNIGYLRLDGMPPPRLCAATMAAALQVVAGADALIIDLRRNNGGSPAMVQWLASHFLPPKTAMSSVVSIRDKETETMTTEAGLPGPQLTQVPLYLLTSRQTFSAAEHLAYDLQQTRRAQVVGEASGGGANPGGFVPVHPGFALWVSRARSVSPVTGGNWEGTGVKPDLVAEASAARRQAFALALKDLEAAKAPSVMPGERAELLERLDRVVERLGL